MLHITAEQVAAHRVRRSHARCRLSNETTDQPERHGEQVDEVTTLEVLPQHKRAEQKQVEGRSRLQKNRVG